MDVSVPAFSLPLAWQGISDTFPQAAQLFGSCPLSGLRLSGQVHPEPNLLGNMGQGYHKPQSSPQRYLTFHSRVLVRILSGELEWF